VWRQLDPKLWETTRNPWGLLQTVSRDQIERRFADPVFRKTIDSMVQNRRTVLESPAQAPARQVVYIENTPMFVQTAEGSGIRSVPHTDYASTRAKLASLGLASGRGTSHAS
jgi:hypothetical protein